MPQKKLKVYCETSFWSYLNGGRTTLAHIAVKQAVTCEWWDSVAPSCEIFISPFVDDEAEVGDPEFARLRMASMDGAASLDGSIREVSLLASSLLAAHAVPENETADASHISVAAVYGMDVLLTWNCRQMANPVTLPKTASVIRDAGYQCPVITTPEEFLKRKEEFGYGN
jgi:hypothetical protein